MSRAIRAAVERGVALAAMALLVGCELVTGLDELAPPDGADASVPEDTIVSYALEEAADGTAPSAALDDASGFHLAIHYDDNARYVTVGEDRGIAWDEPLVGGRVAKTIPDSLLERLSHSRALTLELVVALDEEAPDCPRFIHLGTAGGDGRLAICHRPGSVELRRGQQSIATATVQLLGPPRVLHVTTPADTVPRFFVDGEPAPTEPMNAPVPLDLQSGHQLVVGNRPQRDRAPAGVILHAAIYGAAFDADRARARAGALLSLDDG